MTKKRVEPSGLPLGRPSKYDPKYCDEIIEYFDVKAYEYIPDDKGNHRVVCNTFPTLARFARKIGVDHDTLLNWTETHPDFFGAYKVAKKLQESVLAEGALAGAYQGSFAIFTAKNVCGWRDQSALELTGKDGGPVKQDVTHSVSGDAMEALRRMREEAGEEK